MFDERKTRFKSAEEALRFYFRLRELLHSGRTRRLVADELPADACTVAINAIDDYRCIGWCMRGLDEIALWLLSEIYGPTCFGAHRRTFSHACETGRLEFPEHKFRLREVGMTHERALGEVKRALRELGMIPGGRPDTVRELRRRIGTVGQVHLPGSRAVHRG
jgi:hypothetical protein